MPLDRQVIVRRHAPRYDRWQPHAPLTVGNGSLAFTADATGLQTLERPVEEAVPTLTLSNWGWHRFPEHAAHDRAEVERDHFASGRERPFAADAERFGEQPAWSALRESPHRFNLLRLGLTGGASVAPSPEAFDAFEQTLDPWTGRLDSSFRFAGAGFRVTTACHDAVDAVGFRVEIDAGPDRRVGLRVAFPRPGHGLMDPGSFDRDELHATEWFPHARGATWNRTLDATAYRVTGAWNRELEVRQLTEHAFELVLDPPGAIELVLRLVPLDDASKAADPHRVTSRELAAPSFGEVLSSAAEGWKRFWNSGAAIDLSESTDPRWRELERRTVLSQYLVRANAAGPLPPQESGLTSISWHGKHHLEMLWWHGVHHAYWGREERLAPFLGWLLEDLPEAEALARRQGFPGVRWPKMCGPDGIDSPSGVGAFLLWHQPHPIYYAELMHRCAPGAETLERYTPLVEETARFLAAVPQRSERNGRFHLEPPLYSAREFCLDRLDENRDPGFELAYWRWALRTANAWRVRTGRPADPAWAEIADLLAPAPTEGGVYVEQRPAPPDGGHPMMLGMAGFLPPGEEVDSETMRRTLHHVLARWDFANTWGWDFPLIAMTAARLGEPERAIDALLMDVPANASLPNGHHRRGPLLPAHLPANGGLLSAVAMMAAGWDGGPDRPAPGFPRTGWRVRAEGFRQVI